MDKADQRLEDIQESFNITTGGDVMAEGEDTYRVTNFCDSEISGTPEQMAAEFRELASLCTQVADRLEEF